MGARLLMKKRKSGAIKRPRAIKEPIAAKGPVPFRNDDDDEAAAAARRDPFNNQQVKVRKARDALEREEEKLQRLACQRYNANTWKSSVCDQYFLTIEGKMTRAMRNHVEGSTTRIMSKREYEDFRHGRIEYDVSVKPFVFDMKHGQRNTLGTVTVYAELNVENSDIYTELFVDGDNWNGDDAFYTLLRFFIACSGRRGNRRLLSNNTTTTTKSAASAAGGDDAENNASSIVEEEEEEDEDAEDDGGIENLGPLQLIMLRNMFLERLVHFFRFLSDYWNTRIEPNDSFVDSELLGSWIESHKK